MQAPTLVHVDLEGRRTGRSHRQVWAVTALVTAVALTGCVVAPTAPAYGYGGDITASVAPPAPYVETIPVAPVVGSIWIGGFWDWEGGRHVWRPGHYEHARPGYTYRQPAWRPGGGGQWMLHRGGWERR
ncbi:YXWGXW repeat-containing protein [Comamonas sp. 26]|uniref:YXWGXW repeat-containing protein n=1 Tax=Comamonas sp. 26 TaxID=2035201 RepID=UPI000C183967|nr:YXWGXW repeat-containing protein [Comamonas sp. 26]PIG09242.1 YXWGXW repeat-containing protein [Comamonas sp. 26]